MQNVMDLPNWKHRRVNTDIHNRRTHQVVTLRLQAVHDGERFRRVYISARVYRLGDAMFARAKGAARMFCSFLKILNLVFL